MSVRRRSGQIAIILRRATKPCAQVLMSRVTGQTTYQNFKCSVTPFTKQTLSVYEDSGSLLLAPVTAISPLAVAQLAAASTDRN